MPKDKTGVRVSRMQDVMDERRHDITVPHRDTHYLFCVIEEGMAEMQVDFKSWLGNGPCILLIWPRQVHRLLRQHRQVRGYSISFDQPLMPVQLQAVLEHQVHLSPFLQVSPAVHEQLLQLAILLHDLKTAEEQPFNCQGLHGLLQAMLALMANAAAASAAGDCSRSADSRRTIIEQDFQQLLHRHFREWKKPANYAAALAISVSHLNDVVHAVSGCSVSQHIQQLVILEAKRMLYHTQLSVKEISDQLGYADHGYFSRLFKKITTQTPLGFRQQFWPADIPVS